eukprot:2660610-Alexandrium_andersonii.AAC.1
MIKLQNLLRSRAGRDWAGGAKGEDAPRAASARLKPPWAALGAFPAPSGALGGAFATALGALRPE